MEKFSAFIIRMRWFIIITVAILTAFLAYFIKDLRINADVMGYLPDDDCAAILFKEIGENYGGMPVILMELSNVIIHDIRFIAPLAFVLICFVLLMGFRNTRGVIIPMLTVLIAITWTMGLISLLGYEITLMTNIIPVVLLAVGSAYAIHVVNRINGRNCKNCKKSKGFFILPFFK